MRDDIDSRAVIACNARIDVKQVIGAKTVLTLKKSLTCLSPTTAAIVRSTGLGRIARRLGALDDAAEQISRHRKQRAAWHAWLDRNLVPELAEHEVEDPEVDLYWIPPSETELDWVGTLWRVA